MNTSLDTALRVVIIDDTADLRDLLRVALDRGGMCVVGEAGDGQAGIEAVRIANPDVVLLDLSMPVMDGLEALPHIRKLAPEAQIVVLSGFGASELAERALEAGADGYVEKGVSLARILDYVREVVADRRAPSSLLVPLTAAAPEARSAGIDPPDHVHARSDDGSGPGACAALERAPFGIVELGADPPYRLMQLNDAARALLEYGPPLSGMPLQQIAPELAVAIAANRLSGDVDFEVSAGDVPLHVSLRPSGPSLMVYLHSITDEADMLRSAIATAAHEIRGPVGVLCGVAETLALVGEGDLEPSLKTRLLATAQRQSHVLEGMTADLLTAAQIHRGTVRVEPRALDPVALVTTLIQERYPGTVAVEAHDLRAIWADGLRLEQMVGNLLSNAHKYGQPPIVVRTRPCMEQADLLCIDVQDDGRGVPAEFQPQLFREFSRASGTVCAGTGLGLHVVQSLAKAQGGAVSYADAPGGGAVFTLTLPTVAA